MANNLIQIKRSINTSVPGSLANGELAYTSNGDILYIGNPANGQVTAIGGKRFPGTLTANHALVANASGYLDVLRAASLNIDSTAVFGSATVNVVITSTQIALANSTSNTKIAIPTTVERGGNYYLKADGSWSTVTAGSAAPSGANTNVQYNDSGVTAGSDAFTFNETTNSISVSGDALVGGAINAASHTVGTSLVANATGLWTAAGTVNAAIVQVGTAVVANATGVWTTGTVNAASHTAGATGTGTGGTVANTTTFFVGNNTVNTVVTNGGVTINGTTLIANTTGVYHTGTVNAASFTAGATGTGTGGSVQNTTTMFVGNNTVNTVQTNGGFSINGTTLVANTLGVYHTGTVNAASHTVGTSVVANATGVWTTGTVNAAVVQVGTNFAANTTRITVAVPIIANGATGGAGQVLTTNSTGFAYWATPTGAVTSVTGGNGMVENATTGAVQLDVGAGNGISVNATAVAVNPGVGIASNSTGTHVLAGSGITANSTGVFAVAANGISVAAGGIAVTGGPTLTVNSTGVHVNSSLSITDLTLAGNLTVQGTLTTIDTTNLAVEDPMIKLAINNGTANTVDIGFYGLYGNATFTGHTGLFRDTSDNGIYKLFQGLTLEPTTTVDTSNTSFAIATLQTFLLSGGLVSNTSNVQITANSTLGVNITANTLTLSTALVATSGGTGQSTYAAGDILVGNTGNTLSKLTLGTGGYVLQSNGTALVYDTLDGGTF